MFITHML